MLQPASTEIILKQILKTFSIYALRRKLFQGIPVIGMAIGSTVNYRLTRNVTEFANRFYQVRHIVEKEKEHKKREAEAFRFLIACFLDIGIDTGCFSSAFSVLDNKLNPMFLPVRQSKE